MQLAKLIINEHKKGRRFPLLVSSHLMHPGKALLPCGQHRASKGQPLRIAFACGRCRGASTRPARVMTIRR
jgi:hypothetical protein